ncbi:AEC family transporter [Methylomonas paludis]|uniref:AEC family transporter n=1 Tax=Methylomonas paludis TaxID=1173101 RepID=A0A975R8R2_9GAMM|nr:AEC family transporter [Methylomonas paludis]QWF69498.1 AEC family transporter [Methylomonas paludis]
MQTTLLQMTALIMCGALWGVTEPGGLSAQQTRLVLTSVVYYFFLPAMVVEVLWHAEIGWQSMQYSALGTLCIILGIALSWLIARLCRFSHPKTGAVILAAAFPNVTYLGLPVLEQTFGSWARSVVIQIDLFATAPVVYTLGIMLAKYFGEVDSREKPMSVLAFLGAPPFLAAILAVALNLAQVPVPEWLEGLLQKCSAAVAPLMIFSLGMALSWRAVRWRNLPYIMPVLLVKLLLQPLAAMYLAAFMTVSAEQKAAAVLDIAMPSMILGIVLCDRYKLDSSLYATAVTLGTALSLVSLPIWYRLL